jgi:hypothetical protein
VRRGVLIAVAALLTVAAIFGVLVFFSARDDSTIGTTTGAPGEAADDVRSPALGRGNVVLRFSDAGFRAPLRALAAEYGPASLHEQGEAVIVERDPSARGVVALAYKRRLQATNPDDPALRQFIDYWLGRGTMR